MVSDETISEVAQQLLTNIEEQQVWPKRDGDRTIQLRLVLSEAASKCGLTEDHGFRQYGKYEKKKWGGEWMNIDFWWWEENENGKQGWLSAESQWWNERWPPERNREAILEDFQKLPSLKSHIKLMVFNSDKESGDTLIREFDNYLSGFLQHTGGECYLVVRFDRNKYACAWRSTVDGSQKAGKFEPFQPRSGNGGQQA